MSCCGGLCGKVIEQRLMHPTDSYDNYSNSAYPGVDELEYCALCGSPSIAHGHAHIFKIGADEQRKYVIVYECGYCGHEIFEEDYMFKCVAPEQCTAPE